MASVLVIIIHIDQRDITVIATIQLDKTVCGFKCYYQYCDDDNFYILLSCWLILRCLNNDYFKQSFNIFTFRRAWATDHQTRWEDLSLSPSLRRSSFSPWRGGMSPAPGGSAILCVRWCRDDDINNDQDMRICGEGGCRSDCR